MNAKLPPMPLDQSSIRWHPGVVWLCGLFLVLLSCACARPLGPISPYNDRWNGYIRLNRDRTLPLRIRVYVTEADARDPSAVAAGKKVFAEIEVDGLGPIAASGSASHFDYRQLKEESHGPLAGREFLELRVGSAGIAVPNGLKDTQCYSTALASVLSNVAPGVLRDNEQGDLELIAELQHGSLLDGIVVLRVSWTGDCAHWDQGRCDQWHSGARTVVLGAFRADRLGPTPGIVRIDPGTIHSGKFIFHRTEVPPNGTSWEMAPTPEFLRCEGKPPQGLEVSSQPCRPGEDAMGNCSESDPPEAPPESKKKRRR